MPADEMSVNLLGHDALEESPIGRIISWATTYGRYIMIATEVVVLLAFISRFSLDRRLTDLNDEISQKQAIIQANQPFEQDFRTLQKKLNDMAGIIQKEERPLEIVQTIKSILPIDVYLKDIAITETSVNMNVVAGSTAGFASFISNLKTVKDFNKINLSDIKRSPDAGITFSISIDLTKQNAPLAQTSSAAQNQAGGQNP